MIIRVPNDWGLVLEVLEALPNPNEVFYCIYNGAAHVTMLWTGRNIALNTMVTVSEETILDEFPNAQKLSKTIKVL